MRIRRRHRLLVLCASGALAAVFAPAVAMAEHRPQAFDARATISSCGGDGLTIAAEVAPSSGARDERVAQRAVRAIRGATLRLRFEAAPLYGASRRGREIDLGRTTSARRFERFGDLPAQTYSGVVRYRWVRGSRTVASGIVRTRRVRAAGRRGRAHCSLRVGRKPVDTRAPFVLPLPYDSTWRRGPLDVYLFAVDDLSGVALVVWRLDGGPFTRGRNVQITTEGSHELTYAARDAAGNETSPATVTLRVDTNAPTTPTVTAPSGPTTDSTPELRWSASSDSGSGVKGYVALVRDAGGAIVWSQAVGQSATPSASVDQALPPGDYTAEVVAFDGTAPEPFTSKGTSSFSVVGDNTTADSDADGLADTSDNCPFTANADQADNEGDGAGDACDSNDDNDGTPDGQDNCVTVPNDQANTGGTAAGDACEDRDNDGVLDAADNCKDTGPATQADVDGDGRGNVCDDSDGDTLTDHAEINRKPDPTLWNDSDTDNDSFPDNTDPCPTEPEAGVDVQPEGCP